MAKPKVRVVMNEKVVEQLARTKEVAEVLTKATDIVKARAAGLAPVKSGAWASSLITMIQTRKGKDLVGIVQADDHGRAANPDSPYSGGASIEFGTKASPFGPTPRHRALGRALDGLRI